MFVKVFVLKPPTSWKPRAVQAPRPEDPRIHGRVRRQRRQRRWHSLRVMSPSADGSPVPCCWRTHTRTPGRSTSICRGASWSTGRACGDSPDDGSANIESYLVKTHQRFLKLSSVMAITNRTYIIFIIKYSKVRYTHLLFYKPYVSSWNIHIFVMISLGSQQWHLKTTVYTAVVLINIINVRVWP